jgi:hypothetical protein
MSQIVTIRKNKLLAWIYGALALGLGLSTFWQHHEHSAPVAASEPYVVFLVNCGKHEGVIITTDPIQWVDWQTPPTPELIEIVDRAIADKRTKNFVTGLWGTCPNYTPEAPKEPVYD